jgi:hypothetical protein
MTEPLIDRDGIARAMYLTPDHPDWKPCLALSDAVMAYLRSVLTPEALDPQEEWHGKMGELSRGWSDGFDLHRRILGDKP